jgi:hypothetical protein
MTTEAFDHVQRLLQACYPPGYEKECLDADLRVNTQLALLHDAGELNDTAHELDKLLELCTDEDAARRMLQPWMGAAIPRDRSYMVTLEGLSSIAAQGRENPSCLVRLSEEDDRPRTFRASRFLDLETANSAATEVLRHHEAAVRSWQKRPGGIRRQHCYADLGRAVGIVKDTRRGFSGEVTGAVVILVRDDDARQVGIYEAYPELPLDEGIRRRYPDLPHIFGAYFGDVPDRPWLAQEDFHVSSGTGTHGPMKEQMRQLVTLDDEDLSLAVDALGSHVLPGNIRAWIQAMHWRMQNSVVADENMVPVDRLSLGGRDPRALAKSSLTAWRRVTRR